MKELYNLINEKLFVYPICAAEHKDCCMKASDDGKIGAKGKAITIGQFPEGYQYECWCYFGFEEEVDSRGQDKLFPSRETFLRCQKRG